MKLSICISSLSRRHALLSRLLGALAEQAHPDVEVLVAIDDGSVLLPVKRNRLIAQATGEYIVHIDDDDLVALNYVRAILAAVEIGADAIAIRGARTDASQREPTIVFDYQLMSGRGLIYDDQHVLWRSPGHLCAIKAEIVRAVPFPEVVPEDIEWVALVHPHIKTVARAGEPGEILYHYLWDSQRRPWYQP